MKAVVLTSDEDVFAMVPNGVTILTEDPNRHGLNEQLEYASDALSVKELLILHADLPLATPEALHNLIIQAPPSPSATLVIPEDGGTNAMLLRPPGLFSLAFGGGSGDLHRAAAQKAGLEVLQAKEPALALDLDTPADVRELISHQKGRACETGRYLIKIGIEERRLFHSD